MGKMKRFLAVFLAASMLLGSNGFSYAAEVVGTDSTASPAETVAEVTEPESEDYSEVSADTSAVSEATSASDTDSEAIAEEQAQDESASGSALTEEASEADEEATDPVAEETGEEDAVSEETTEEAATSAAAEETATEEATTSEAATSEAAAAATTEKKAEEVVYTAGELKYHSGSYDVSLAYDESAEIPADAELKVREITKGTSEYEAYLSGAQAASDKGVADARFFDITIWANGKEIQPKSAVRVNITYNNAIEVADEGEVQAMHFEGGSSDPDVLDTDTNGGSEVDEIAFDAESFSVYGIIYTVDFTYDGYTYSISGEDSILLSDLAEILGLYEEDLDKAFSVYNVSDVTFTDYDLIKIEKQADGDWLLTSLAPFSSDETLTITMNDGVKFVIDVTDAQESSDLTDFLTKVTISGATQNADGSYTVEQGKEYGLTITCAESSTYQFDNDATLTYTMPDGVQILEAQSGDMKINIVYKGKTYQVDASYTLDTDGNLEITFDQDDPDYPRLVDSTNVSFRFTINGSFDGSETNIKFSDSVERVVEFDEPEPGEVYAAKSAVYDEATGTFTYTIKVTASGGDVTNVNVKDVISGDAIVFNNGVTVSGNSSSYADNGATNGFDYTFASMKDGEEITITYTGTADFSKDSDNDGKITADQTKNTVTVQPEGGKPHSSEYSREISYKSTSKSSGKDAGTTADGDKILEWTITYNELRLASAAGDTIKDTISSSSTAYMKYYGDGITVKVYDKSGTLVETRTISYSDLTSYSDSSWTYTIPGTDTTPYIYMYEIVY